MTAPDPPRVERARQFLADGATVETKGHGVLWLVRDGRWLMTVTATTLRAARDAGEMV